MFVALRADVVEIKVSPTAEFQTQLLCTFVQSSVILYHHKVLQANFRPLQVDLLKEGRMSMSKRMQLAHNHQNDLRLPCEPVKSIIGALGLLSLHP